MKVRNLIAILITAIAFLYGCDDKRVYDSYVHTPRNGWEKNDYLSFTVPPLTSDGLYAMRLQLRTDNAFPFRSMVMIVDGEVLPSEKQLSDTLVCHLIDAHGNTLGQGINIYQYTFDIREQRLSKGDSLSLHVRHDMKREMLPGIIDVGLMLEKR